LTLVVAADEGTSKVVDSFEAEGVEVAAAEVEDGEVDMAELVAELAFRGWKMSFCAPSNHPHDA
jgi:hypothetical protein